MVAALPELHLHLDGSLRRETAVELAQRYKVNLPERFYFEPGMGLRAALDMFATSLALLQHPSAVRRVAHEICEDAEVEGVTTLEIRFAPQLHQRASLKAIVDAALEGIDGRAGLILCGLYGEPPTVLDRLVETAVERPGVVGIDLAGGPAPGQRYGLHNYQAAYKKARRFGLGRTVHAGEGRPADEIRAAIEVLGAQRIGHGCSLLEDMAVVDLVLERGVTIEACPTSNVHTGIYPSVADHPLPRWLAEGVKACVCVDNTLFSHNRAREEYQRVLAIPGMSPEKLQKVIKWGHEAAFRRN